MQTSPLLSQWVAKAQLQVQEEEEEEGRVTGDMLEAEVFLLSRLHKAFCSQ